MCRTTVQRLIRIGRPSRCGAPRRRGRRPCRALTAGGHATCRRCASRSGTIGARTFDFSRQVAVMAVVNRTPDSFFDQGRTYAFDRAVDAVLRAVALGADWVDIGGAPFAPGAADARSRRRSSGSCRSCEALRGRVRCRDLGRHVPRRGRPARHRRRRDRHQRHDRAAATRRSRRSSPTAMRPSSSPTASRSRGARFPRPHYDDVVAEVAAFLRDRVDRALAAGIPEERIIVDPGPRPQQEHAALARAHAPARARSPTSASRRSPPSRTRTSSARPSTRHAAERLEGSLAAAVDQRR